MSGKLIMLNANAEIILTFGKEIFFGKHGIPIKVTCITLIKHYQTNINYNINNITTRIIEPNTCKKL